MSTFVHTDALRALEIVDRVPAGCIGVIVTREDFEPHLRHVEVAIVDTADTLAVHGELYAIEVQQRRGGRRTSVLAIVQAYERDGGLMVRYGLEAPGIVPMSDGPFTDYGWQRKCVGRIVAAMRPTWQASR